MAMWSCPHCGTPQEETSRCWVCRRSSVCCATCRHVRWAVAGGLAYCGLDRQRQPIRSDDVRPCWEMAPAQPASNDRSIVTPASAAVRRDFVPLEALVGPGPGGRGGPQPVGPAGSGWTLFVDDESSEVGGPIA